MKQDFMEDFKCFLLERVNSGTVNPKISELNKKTINIEDSILSATGSTSAIKQLLMEYEETYSQIIGLHIDDAYMQGMRDAHSFMELMKGSGNNE